MWCEAKLLGVRPNSPQKSPESNAVIADQIKRHKAGRVIEFLSVCPEFEDLQENNFLEMNFADLAEFFCMQLAIPRVDREAVRRFVDEVFFATPMAAVLFKSALALREWKARIGLACHRLWS